MSQPVHQDNVTAGGASAGHRHEVLAPRWLHSSEGATAELDLHIHQQSI
jgi:hypothetical protein